MPHNFAKIQGDDEDRAEQTTARLLVEENARLRNALEAVKRHQERMLAGNSVRLSETWQIAQKALGGDALSEQKKPSAAALRIASVEAGLTRRYDYLLESADGEIRPLTEALIAVTPDHRERGRCWCEPSWDKTRFGHEPKCRKALRALTHALGGGA